MPNKVGSLGQKLKNLKDDVKSYRNYLKPTDTRK